MRKRFTQKINLKEIIKKLTFIRKPPRLEGKVQNRGIKEKKK